jgi:P4 family phage/plasmid primase-like protien
MESTVTEKKSMSQSTRKELTKLFEILERVRVTDNSPVNLITMQPPGKYNVDSETLKDIWKHYSKLIDKVPLHFAEIPKDISYFKIDADLESDNVPKKRLYSQKTITKLIDYVRIATKKYLSIDKDDLMVYVMEKEQVDKKGDVYRDGFHLIFPHIVQNRKVRNAILDDVISSLEKENIFEVSQPINKIIDRNASVSNTPWLMLGSSKPESSPYKITQILNYKNKSLELEENDTIKHIELLSLLNHDLNLENSAELNDNINMAEIDAKFSMINNSMMDSFIPTLDKDVTDAKILVKMLSSSRADNYEDWIKVGYCLYNIDKTLLNEWIEFSKLSPSKFKKGECEKLWSKMKTGKDMLTIRSLHMWARNDNYVKYMEYKNIEYNNLFRQTMTGDHQSIANAIYAKYQTEFVCASIKNKTWYQFNQVTHKWEQIDSGYSLVRKITDDFINDYYQKNANYYNMMSQTTDPNKKQEMMKEIEKIQVLINRLNNESFLSTLMQACARRFYMKGFEENLDENYDLIGFNNGVFDLKKGIFRKGEPEDFLTMNCGLDYQNFDEKSDEVKKILKLFEDIHPNKETREYVYTLFSTFIAGHHREETLHLFNGVGYNGKSVTFELLKHTLGDYFMSVPITLLTRKRAGAEQASPVLAQLKGKRLGVLQEPEEGEELSVGLMKELTGNDEIQARKLHQDPITFKPQIKFAIPCNNLPKVPARDKGTWRRLRVIDHPSEFVESPDSKQKHQKKRDDSLKYMLPDLAPQFMSFLIHRYLNVYQKTGLKICESVNYATNMYNQDNNCIKQFVDSKLEITKNKSDKLTHDKIWEEFKAFFKSEFESVGNKRPTSKELMNYCIQVLGQMNGKFYTGVILANTNGDADDVDENVKDI